MGSCAVPRDKRRRAGVVLRRCKGDGYKVVVLVVWLLLVVGLVACGGNAALVGWDDDMVIMGDGVTTPC